MLLSSDAMLIRVEDEALCLDRQVAVLSVPSSSYLDNFRRFLKAKEGGIYIRGPLLVDRPREEYAVTYNAPEADRLSNLIERAIIWSHIPFFKVSVISYMPLAVFRS